MSDIHVLGRIVIPEEELEFRYSRSSGPGGQHVNRVETRVTLRFDVGASASLTETQRRRVRGALATRIGKDDVLRISSQRYRSREGNKRAAIERFAELLTEALRPRTPRKRTRVPRGAKKRRLDTKRRRGDIKKSRRGGGWDD